jgi:hypothetical protein
MTKLRRWHLFDRVGTLPADLPRHAPALKAFVFVAAACLVAIAAVIISGLIGLTLGESIGFTLFVTGLSAWQTRGLVAGRTIRTPPSGTTTPSELLTAAPPTP